jgi:hypothetical protein
VSATASLVRAAETSKKSGCRYVNSVPAGSDRYLRTGDEVSLRQMQGRIKEHDHVPVGVTVHVDRGLRLRHSIQTLRQVGVLRDAHAAPQKYPKRFR